MATPSNKYMRRHDGTLAQMCSTCADHFIETGALVLDTPPVSDTGKMIYRVAEGFNVTDMKREARARHADRNGDHTNV
jgi:hypothetical protein